MKSKMVSFHVPADKELLAAFGEVAIRHEHMNHVLKMTVKSLTGVSVAEALKATLYESSTQLRDRIRKIARKRLGEGTSLVKLQAMLADCKKLTEKRNELVHGLLAKELDGDAHIRDVYGNAKPLPTVAELHQLSQELERLTGSFNHERLEGFLFHALSKREPRSEDA